MIKFNKWLIETKEVKNVKSNPKKKKKKKKKKNLTQILKDYLSKF